MSYTLLMYDYISEEWINISDFHALALETILNYTVFFGKDKEKNEFVCLRKPRTQKYFLLLMLEKEI